MLTQTHPCVDLHDLIYHFYTSPTEFPVIQVLVWPNLVTNKQPAPLPPTYCSACIYWCLAFSEPCPYGYPPTHLVPFS